jgi:[acyl-carrier-protein] S-malonyltransferase
MVNALAEEYDTVKALYDQASEKLGYDLWKLTHEGPEEELNQTAKTQPALLTAGYAVWKVMQAQAEMKPEFLAGHSLGEYTALVCANAIDFEDAVSLVARRGELMQLAVEPGAGAMAAVLGLDDQAIVDACAASSNGEIVSAVNFNSPGQVVIAGNKAAVERAIEACKEAGAKRAIPLPVSVPSHCALMQPAAEQLEAVLADITINKPSIPVIHNYDVQSHDDAEGIRNCLVKQLYNPVQWVKTLEFLKSQDIESVIECGPGKVLTGLVKRTDKSLNPQAAFDPDSIANVANNVANLAGE